MAKESINNVTASEVWSADNIKRLTMCKIRTLTETQEQMVIKKPFARSLAVAAVCAVLIVGIGATAIATNVFGFRDLFIAEPDLAFSFYEFQGTEEQFMEISPDGTLEDFTIPQGQLFLAGFIGSPEYDAAMEWRDRGISIEGIGEVRWDEESDVFVNVETGEFATDGILFVDSQEMLDSMSAEELEEFDGYTILFVGDIPELYRGYGALTWMDVEKLKEIIERYGLVLHGELFDYFNGNRSWDEFQASIANEQFIDNSLNDFTLYPGYRWESGTFQFDAQYGDIWFSLRSSRKGTFDNVIITNLDITEFSDEWVYENVHGTTLTLVQSAHMSFIIADTESAFIVVSVHAGTTSRVDWEGATFRLMRSDLEHFADLIDFSQLR